MKLIIAITLALGIGIGLSTNASAEEGLIPSWIKTTAEFWVDGKIGDAEFLSALQYLIEQGILVVPQETQIDPPSLDLDAGPSDDSIESQSDYCIGNARCISGTLVEVVDNDTIQVDGEIVRFALVDAPKLKYDGGKSRNFIEQICPAGSAVVVDQDDSQLEDTYGRILGVVYCNDLNINAELLDSGLGDLYSTFCDQSEFSTQRWAQKHGCES